MAHDAFSISLSNISVTRSNQDSVGNFGAQNAFDAASEMEEIGKAEVLTGTEAFYSEPPLHAANPRFFLILASSASLREKILH